MSRRLVSLAAVAASAAAAAFALAGGSPAAHASSSIRVSAKEFSFKLKPSKGHAGSVTFRVVNKGHLTHDFKIAGKKTKLLKPGKSQSITVHLKKGRYHFLCTVKGHAAAGMKGTFRVS